MHYVYLGGEVCGYFLTLREIRTRLFPLNKTQFDRGVGSGYFFKKPPQSFVPGQLVCWWCRRQFHQRILVQIQVGPLRGAYGRLVRQLTAERHTVFVLSPAISLGGVDNGYFPVKDEVAGSNPACW